MASALQCPACGHKHRLSQLTGDPIFSCESCGRLLKTPVEYRRPEPSAPASPPRPESQSRSRSKVQRGGSAARDQTSVIPAAGAAAGSAGATAPRASKPPKPSKAPAAAPAPRAVRGSTPAALGLPILVLGWVAAIVLGGVIVRYVAKWTGLLTGDSVIDLITGSGFGRYLRLFAVVPFWALASAGLMTLFIEGGRRWQARQQTGPVRPATKRPSAVPVPPRRAPQPEPVREPVVREPEREPAPAPPPRQPAPAPTAAESRSPAGAASAPRPRRIPKRDISS
jgi:2-oxoglutarate dehydrogenase E2 component (dihydrolipoamide succinyltransferase)